MLPSKLDRHISGGITGRTVLFRHTPRPCGSIHGIDWRLELQSFPYFIGVFAIEAAWGRDHLTKISCCWTLPGRAEDSGSPLAGVTEPALKLPQPCAVSRTSTDGG